MLSDVQARLDGGDDVLGYLVLQGEEIGQTDIVAMRPGLEPGAGIAQLGGYPKLLSRAPDAAPENIADAQLATDLLGEPDRERKDLIRRVMVGLFTELGPDDPLAREHRRRLSAALN